MNFFPIRGSSTCHLWAAGFLLNGIILPLRSSKSAAAYRKIWTDRGSPLRWHSDDLLAAVRQRLGPEWVVELGMRYQNPSMAGAIERLCAAGVDRIVVFPLYPQLAASTHRVDGR